MFALLGHSVKFNKGPCLKSLSFKAHACYVLEKPENDMRPVSKNNHILSLFKVRGQ